MVSFAYDFDFCEQDATPLRGSLHLEVCIPHASGDKWNGAYRTGRIVLEGDGNLELVLYHNDATAAFIYMRDCRLNPNLMEIIGLPRQTASKVCEMRLPGQLCLGAERVKLMDAAMRGMFAFPSLSSAITRVKQENLAVFPIAREGLKYQVGEAIFANYGFYSDEIILDAHHVFDHSVPLYNRKVEMTLFKDKDLDAQQHENIRVAFIADSIASGLVMKEVIEQIKARFPRVRQVEIIAPLATVRGLCRIARAGAAGALRLRAHVFETLLNALPPDFYYSAHFNIPGFHICPDLQEEYHAWWGRDRQGNFIADTACAGYGWSEVFYSPRRQIRMMDEQLQMRHNLTIAEIVRRNLPGI